jgi:Xaa-Pro aminopeptidase
MTHPYFTAAEFADRTNRVVTRLREAGLAFALFDETEAMTWLTGYGNSETRWRCVGIGPDAEPFFLIRSLDAAPCKERSWITDVPVFRDWDDPMATLRPALAARGLTRARIGVDFGSYCMPPARLAALRAALPDVEWVDVGPLIWELRWIKSEAEIALLRRAAEIADAALAAAAAVCVPGAVQRDAARVVMETYFRMGGDAGPPGPITASKGWDHLHGHLGDEAIVSGDIVHIETTPRIHGYSARVMRGVSVGPADPALQRTAEQLASLQRQQIAAMRPGVVAREVDAIMRDAVLGAGLRSEYDNVTGYTLGLYALSGPRTSDFTRSFTPVEGWVLEPGMVFHMYASARGAAVSETVVVTENGPEILTGRSPPLFVNA